MNLAKILDKLSKKITSEIAEMNNGITVPIELTNIATLNDGDQFLLNKSTIILSLVNIEEEKILRNHSLYKEYPGNGNTVEKYKKPTQNLILSLLFTSYVRNQDSYSEGLDKLEYIIKCLQHNNVFYYDDLNLLEQTEVTEIQSKSMNKLILDLVSLKSDQLNQMWSYLGSRYMPSVLYTMKMIAVQNENNLPTYPVIDKAKIQLWNNDKKDITGEIESNSFPLK
ncbi:MAG TPA: DUF4255 domain-containing protein [Flavobacterium sp.]|uniref:DUF4255 domain-containing protein n=1 Tax=Flavobacterium sp. TaxID=239 RepID=UPI002D1D0C25|nr:DUF4255 domain-containing protein [Flavobacterium sp.]HSD13518.1 DUF4255 domain-containing protein [Flavobacterium sp.]